VFIYTIAILKKKKKKLKKFLTIKIVMVIFNRPAKNFAKANYGVSE